jgi:signal transduction histidine kinase
MNQEGDACDSTPPVLIVDDDPGNLIALEAVLESLDCRSVRADSGHEAVERTRAEDFAAIVMDVRMPGLDGYAAASFIRQDPRSSSTPILFITGQQDIDVARLTQLYGNTGQVDSLQKPFEPDVLRAKIRWWLELFRRGQQVDQLERAMDSAEAQARTKDDVLAIVAHDLKGPLAALKLSTGILRGQAVDGVAEPKFLAALNRHIERALRNIDAMTTIVDDLLDSARFASGTLQLDLAPHPFDDIVAQAIDLLEPLAHQKKVALETGSPSLGTTTLCDRDRMLQVLSNLVGNAVKFTPPEGRVQVELMASDDALIVCVRDSGPGIANDQLPFVFQKYWQGNRKSDQKGVGLGLTIAKEIVLAHRGRMWVESQPGVGTRFFFSIPRVVERTDEIRT